MSIPAVNPLVVVGIMALAVGVVVGLLYLVRRVEPTAGVALDTGRANALYGMVVVGSRQPEPALWPSADVG